MRVWKLAADKLAKAAKSNRVKLSLMDVWIKAIQLALQLTRHRAKQTIHLLRWSESEIYKCINKY